MRLVATILCALALPALAQNPAAALGKERAAASRLEWDLGEAGHPGLGNIHFAVLKSAIETVAGNSRVFSRVYLSCQKATGTLAIELTNTVTPDDPGGLRPAAEPRLVCSRLEAPGERKVVEENLLANWEVSPIGDALARGFRPFPLRECVSIRVLQEVALPPGATAKSARIEFDLHPYSRALDAVFATCGEATAYATPASAPAPAVKPAAAPAAPWITARVQASGKTNVRAAPDVRSAVVVQLHPGSVVLVQRTGNEWWRIRSRSGAAFQGYVREDRLVLP